jgi:tetratricopeptide (TPR) repeat protein
MTGVVAKLLPIWILPITLLAFLPVLLNGFVNWDDKTLVDNPNYRGLGLSQLRLMFTDFHLGQYQPLSWITLGLDHLLWWMDPFGYHLTSLFLHTANAVVLYFIMVRLISLGSFGVVAPREPAMRAAAGFAALIFAIHPLRVEPVAWASARADVVSTLFFLSSVLCYLTAAVPGETGCRWLLWMGASVILYGLSLLSGTAGMALPVILLLLDVYALGRLGGGREKSFGSELRQLLWQKVPFLLLLLGAIAVNVFAVRQGEVMSSSVDHHGLAPRVAHIFFTPAFYLWKTVVPLGLAPLYEPSASSLALGSAMVVAISVGLFLGRRRWPALFAIWICHIALLLPVLLITQHGPQIVADRYSYLSCVPWAILAGSGLLYCRQLWPSGQIVRRNIAFGAGLAASLVLVLGILTWKQTEVWHDSEKLWRHAVAVSRSSGAHHNLAVLLETDGRVEEALEHYRQAARIDSSDWDSHYRAALLLHSQGKVQEAIEHYRSAVQINPTAIEAQNQLAASLVTQGRLEEAVEHFRNVIELNTNAEANPRIRRKRIEHFRNVIELDPSLGETHFRLGMILALQGHLEEAVDHFQQTLKIKPDHVEAMLNLGRVLAARGNLDQAIHYFRQALHFRPVDAELHESLGRALAERGKRDEAAKHLEQALRILKSSPASR